MNRFIALTTIAIGILLSGTGCSTRLKPAILLDPAFRPEAVQQIVLLPAVDARIDRTSEINFETQVRNTAANIMIGRGYAVMLGASAHQLTDDDLVDVEVARMKRFAPPGTRWLMVVSVVDVTSKITFGSTGNAEVAGYLFDLERNAVAWRDKGIGRVGQGGLIGMAMVAGMDDLALSDAMQNLFTSVPRRDTP